MNAQSWQRRPDVETFRTKRAIPTKYRGIWMRSRTEAKVALALDTIGIPWVYEPEIFYRSGARRSGYLPDFQLWPKRPDPWYVEVKPSAIYDAQHTNTTDLETAIERLFIVRHRRPQSTLLLWWADTRNRDLGRLLILTPGAKEDEWVERPAIPWLIAVKAAYQPWSWWRRLTRR